MAKVLDPFGVTHVTHPKPKPKANPGAVGAAIGAGAAAVPAPSPVATATAQEDQPQAAPVTSAMQNNPFQTDPGYLAALANEQAQGQQLDAALKAAQQQAIVQFGDPSLAGLGGFDLDPLTAAMAQQNTQAGNSTLAGLNRQRDQNQQGIQNQLAAHGIIYSGALGQQTGQNQQAYGSELYNAQQGVLSSLAGLARDTQAQKSGLRSNTVGALTSAYDTYVANPQFWGAAQVDDGGAKSAANAAAVAPVTAALGGGSATVKRPKSKLAAPAVKNPFAARNKKQGGY